LKEQDYFATGFRHISWLYSRNRTKMEAINRYTHHAVVCVFRVTRSFTINTGTDESLLYYAG